MADRKAKTAGIPKEPEEVVELDKDERWQARLEEARARREIALREKAASGKTKQRRKPWEEEPGDDADDFEIKPIIQDKPADEKDVDLADRLEAARDARAARVEAVPPKAEPKPVPRPEPVPDAEIETRVVPRFKSKARSFDEIIPPESAPTVAPAPLPKRKKRRGGDLVAPGAPDVIDLAQRYASTLKPPVNVTRPFDTLPQTVETSATPEPMILPVRQARTRRPFGLGLAVLAFSFIPLSQMAPPLEKGPTPPPNPYFGLPPALGLTTSMVWPVRRTVSGEWVPGPVPLALGAAPNVELSPFSFLGSDSGVPEIPGGVLPGGETGLVALPEPDAPLSMAPPAVLGEAPGIDGVPEPLVVPIPRPRPEPPVSEAIEPPVEAPAPEPGPGREDDTEVDRAAPEILTMDAPDARPEVDAPVVIPTPASPLKVTILVPASSDLGEARAIASDTEARGHELARIREVDVSISQPNVRYFFDEDRAEAARLAEAYGAEVKDFTWFRPAPERGTMELWLSGRGSGGDRAPAPAVRTVEDTPQAPPRTITVIRKQPTLLERLLTGAEDEIEIILPDPVSILNNARTAGSGDN